MRKKLKVGLGKRSYDIVIGERLLAEAGAYIAPLLKGRRAIIVSDENVAKLYLHRLTGALEKSGIGCRAVIVPAGEGTKNFAAFGKLLERLLQQQPDRDTAIVALGGGVVGDIAGFAASVLLRGVDFIQIPTTLLSQVDSSVGGKTGINSAFGKNLIGTFHQPKLVLCDIGTLATLPEREMKAGYAEVLKYALIKDKKFFGWLEKNAEKLLTGDAPALAEAVKKSCQAKATIVARDEKESGERALLNFGHTFAHALEAECGYGDELLHGEAVAIGMVLALKLSAAMKLCPRAEVTQVLKHYKKIGLPASPQILRRQWDAPSLMQHMLHDKKAKSGALTLILSRGVGSAFIARDVEKTAIQAVLVEELRAV